MLPEKFDSFETQHPARATVHTFAAGQAIRIYHVLSKPGITADINSNGAIKCANAALHTARGFGNNMPAGKYFAPARGVRIFYIRHGNFSSGDSPIIHANYIINNNAGTSVTQRR